MRRVLSPTELLRQESPIVAWAHVRLKPDATYDSREYARLLLQYVGSAFLGGPVGADQCRRE